MKTKNIIIIALVAILLIVAGAVFSSGILKNDERITTPFKTEFMEGNFTGHVKLVNDSEKFMHSYEDHENNITYNISTVDNASALMEIYQLQGAKNPEKRTFNGTEWNIYFTQAVPSNNSSDTSGKSMNIIICESQSEKQGYMIYMIFGNNSKVNYTLNTFCEAYEDYAEPLIQSITLKESKHVPAISEQFGLTDEQFAQQMDLVHQYMAGNTSALETGE
ncbi:hypothetical protein [Methanobrevibacter oralis]|uniref:Uncharacterized protein n=1 Tax=Methanobrevibacter oralis TaxID=66851 RepID=A0A166BYC9_METOA|nr:hypothetical protein [Methanobrevibacter oralis]KZX13943.1 hypothetical protein MBORA_01820 [Methanobrevibacter oralis]